MEFYNILILGCGNIGVLYDLESPNFSPHVKVFSSDNNFKVTIFDIDSGLSKYNSPKYRTTD